MDSKLFRRNLFGCSSSSSQYSFSNVPNFIYAVLEMVKGNIRKLCKSMGLQKWMSGPGGDEPSLLETEPNDHRPNLAAARYTSWLEDHPPALTSFDEMMIGTQRKQIVVFLDYDGTLSPIVSHPDRAFMSDMMRSAVSEVARHFPTAIISGRSRDKVYEFVKLDEIYYAGSHGMDIMGPPMNFMSHGQNQTNTTHDDKATIFQPAKDYLPSIKKVLKELKRRTYNIPGAFVEDNRFCISVHYRHVSDENYEALEEIIHNVIEEYPLFHLTRGKKVVEIRPLIKWNKGDALTYLLEALGFSDALPFYIGDDRTDEDAFKVVRSRGQGFPIIVSSAPRETFASHSLRDPSEVLSFLIRLAKWGEEMSLALP